MFKTVNTFLAGRKPLATILILVVAITIVNPSPIQIIASPVQQSPARFLSPPFYGTTTVNSVYDHEYPTYDNWPETENNDWVLHYDNTTAGGGARQSYDGHNGIDYDLEYELVRAAASGDVQYAGWRNPANHQGGEGLYVRIHHDNGYYTIYGHMSVLRVQTGDPIPESGEFQRILGISGNTGHSTGPHLHFELEPLNGQYSINPYGWIGGVGNDPWEDWSGLASHDVWLRYPSITNGDVYPSGAPLTAPPINENEPGAFTVDDGGTGFVENPAGCWTEDTQLGWAGDHHWRNVPAQNPGNCTATWNFPGTPGRYNVFVYVPNNHATADAAQYTIRHTEASDRPWSKQSALARVNQEVYPNTYHPSSWVYVGTYYFDNQYGTDYVRLESTPLDPVTDTMMAADAVRFAPVVYRTYLPLVMKRWPPIPDIPMLNAIDNSDNDGNYTVSWQPAYLADVYILQEATNTDFSGAATRYYGSGTSWMATNKPLGTYYYRVKARNSWGDSGWSNVQQAVVSPPSWLYAVADTMVLAGYANVNYGAETDMWAGYDTHMNPDGRNARSLVQFDLSAIPAGTSINQATLWLYLNSSFDDIPDTSRVIATYRVTSSWTEGDVTWNTQPGFGGMYGWVSIPHATWEWYAVDVTDLVRSWANGQYGNYGIWILGNEDSEHPNWRGFCTREYSGGCGAWLQVTYSGTMGAGAPLEAPGVLPETFHSPLPLPEDPEAQPEMFRSPLPVPESPDAMPELLRSPLPAPEP